MRTFGYGLGLALVLAGAAIGVAELFTIVQGTPSTLSFGAIWYRIHANSLVGFQALIENGLSPALWPPVQFLLTLPAWLLLVPAGLLFLVLCRPRGAAR